MDQQRVTIMGLGLYGGGAGAARHFSRLGHRVTVTDLRGADTLARTIESLADLPLRYVLEQHRDEDFSGCDLLVVNPAVRPGNRLVELSRASGARVTTEFDLGLEVAAARGARAVAVTGSNGKSTTALMLTRILEAHDANTQAGGNIGGSLLESAPSLPEGAPLVLEVSSFQLFRLGTFPGLRVAVFTNLSPNHLDWHPTLEHYYGSKKRLFDAVPPDARAVLNAEDSELRSWAPDDDARVSWFAGAPSARSEAVFPRDGALLRQSAGTTTELVRLDHVAVAGPHDLSNAAAAAAAASAFGVSPDAIGRGLRAYVPMGHRLQEVARHEGLRFVDDSACTTPESAMAALASVEGPVALIAGGNDKGASFEPFARALVDKAAGVALLGAAGDRIADAISPQNPATGAVLEVARVADLAEAFHTALAFLGERGTLLLSPAAASLDTFPNYKARGDAFAGLARDWIAKRGKRGT